MEEGTLADKIDTVTSDLRIVVQELRGNSDATLQLVQAIRDGNSQDKRSAFSAFVSGICIATGVLCAIVMIGFIAMENRSYAAITRGQTEMKTHYDAQLDQLRAWREVQGNDIALLKAKQNPQPNGR